MPLKDASAIYLELCIVAIGWALLWRHQFSHAAREHLRGPRPLPRWPLPASAFGGALLAVTLCWFIAMICVSQLSRHFPALKSDEVLYFTVVGALSQGGLLAGVALARTYIKYNVLPTGPLEAPGEPLLAGGIWYAGFVTFLITVSIVYPVSWLWERLLVAFEFPVQKQELVEVFTRTESVPRLTLLVLVATVLAPITEELIFRAGLFRYLRFRAPRWVALVLPALVFASLHVDFKTLDGLISFAPLAALGIIFSLAYERTGRISVAILAHGFFNLHTVIFLLAGVSV